MEIAQRDIRIIGIIGHMNSGKTTAAQYFMRKQGFYEIGFSAAMKRAMALLAIPLTRENMQLFGTEIIRKQWNEDQWLFAWEDQVRNSFSSYGMLSRLGIENKPFSVVVPDVRFINEFRFIIEKYKGFTLGLQGKLETLYQRARKRPDREPPKTYEAFLASLEHPSEKHIDELLKRCRMTIDSNHHTAAELHEELEKKWPRIERYFEWRKGKEIVFVDG